MKLILTYIDIYIYICIYNNKQVKEDFHWLKNQITYLWNFFYLIWTYENIFRIIGDYQLALKIWQGKNFPFELIFGQVF